MVLGVICSSLPKSSVLHVTTIYKHVIGATRISSSFRAFTSVFLAFSGTDSDISLVRCAAKIPFALEISQSSLVGFPWRLKVIMLHCTYTSYQPVSNALLSSACILDDGRSHLSPSRKPAIRTTTPVLHGTSLSTHCLSLPYSQCPTWVWMCILPFLLRNLSCPRTCIPCSR